MRKNKGDITFFLSKNGNVYHLIKKKKIYCKRSSNSGRKTTKKIVSDFYFNDRNFNYVDFSENGLRPCDRETILIMINEINGLCL